MPRHLHAAVDAALLAYLAVTARPHSRDRLCAMFWNIPDDPRAALRWSLMHLRPIIDEPDRQRIIADREIVGLDPGSVAVATLVRLQSSAWRAPVLCGRLRSLVKPQHGRAESESLQPEEISHGLQITDPG